MNYGFVATAAVTPKIKVADVTHNGAEIEKYMRKASECNTGITVFPELCLTGATCGDVFKQELLLTAAKEELLRLVKVSEELSGLMIVGFHGKCETNFTMLRQYLKADSLLESFQKHI